MRLLIFCLLVAVTCAQQPKTPTRSSLEPFMSSTGNTSSILVFLDLHRSYHDNACSDIDWDVFELALILKYTSDQQVVVDNGIEIYDTCGSKKRVTEIIRYRLAGSSCDHTTNFAGVSGVISYSSKDVNYVISDNFDQLQIVIGEGREHDTEFTTAGDLYLEMSSLHNVKMMIPFLTKLDWTYVTTIYDEHPDSLLKHAIFRKLADDNDICVQSSFVFEDFNLASNSSMPDVKTDGVIIFVNHPTRKLPTVAIAKYDDKTGLNGYPTNGLVFQDAYNLDMRIPGYVANDLWNMTSLDDLSREYYLSKFNCSYMNETVSEDILCDNTSSSAIENHFYDVTGYRTIHMMRAAFHFLKNVADDMYQMNCTGFSKGCFDADKVPSNSPFKIINSSLVENISSTQALFVHEDDYAKGETFQTRDFAAISPPIETWWTNISDVLPPSKCQSWCPSCQATKCSNVKNDKPFDGEYMYIPGDVLITGLFPMSKKWNRVSGQAVCSGFDPSSNTGILSEAFMYAVVTAQARYPSLLPNASIGALMFDTCDDLKRATQILLNFESCQYNFAVHGNSWNPSPAIVPAYVIPVQEKKVPQDVFELDKMTLALDNAGNIHGNTGSMYDSSKYNFEAVVHFLKNASLTYVGVITSDMGDTNDVSALFELAASKNICIEYHTKLSSANSVSVIDVLQDSSASVVLVFANSDDVDRLFRSLTTRPFVKTWILMETRKDWLDITSFPLPLGSVIFHRQGNQNKRFNQHLDNVLANSPSNLSISNSWFEKYRSSRSGASFSSDALTRMQASDLIKAVDITLDTLQRSAQSVCGNKTTTLCPEFLDRGSEQMINEMNNVWFTYQEEMLKISKDGETYENYIISNLQTSGVVEVGRWLDQQLILNKDKLKSYSSRGTSLPEFRESYCFGDQCSCAGASGEKNNSGTDEPKIQLDYEMGFTNSTAEFKKDLWVLIVVIIAGTGSLMTLFLMIYIMCKVCAGALMRRYLALGLLLLVAMVFLFLSVLPFLFTPSENVCGMRYFAHGFSYALCFGVMLAKMMTLRDYKYIGLGGEISRLNQLLTVFFIVSVQVAIGVQWWVLRTPVVYTETISSPENMVFYACDFVRADFISYHSYVLLLLVLCCVYSLCVRHETKNMNESRLLLISSWACLVFWIAIIVTIFVLDRKYLEAICAIGILANALTMMVVIYLPKLTAISRLKYEVSEQKARKENGYKLDTDFQFERPYSLPGTLHSSITDKALTYPRSLATFDTSLSY